MSFPTFPVFLYSNHYQNTFPNPYQITDLILLVITPNLLSCNWKLVRCWNSFSWLRANNNGLMSGVISHSHCKLLFLKQMLLTFLIERLLCSYYSSYIVDIRFQYHTSTTLQVKWTYTDLLIKHELSIIRGQKTC